MVAGGGDPIRILTMIASAVTLVLALRHVRLKDGFTPRHIFVAAWCLDAVIFYSVYYLSGRWSPPFDVLQPFWPPVLVAHAALSLLTLQVWRFIGGTRGK